MPQMAPLNWLTLYIAFLIILILFICQNYYFNIKMIDTTKKEMKKFQTNWKW